MNFENRLVIVSNRLPITVQRDRHGIEIQASSGGLVSALLPLFKSIGGFWVGWPGTDHDPQIESVLRTESAPDYVLEPVFLSPSEKARFYDGFCNETLWPLFHDLQSTCAFDPLSWSAYLEVNSKFADAVERVAHADDLVWVHDYHLMMLADRLRSRGVRSRLAYFHHIPFPSPNIFEKLPWRMEVLRSLMRFNTLGFQTDRDRKSFFSCLRRFCPDVRLRRNETKFLVSLAGQHTEVGTFPISVDFGTFSRESAEPEVHTKTEELRHNLAGRLLLLGIDRLDYTKGIPERLSAFQTLLQSDPEIRGRVAFVQLVVPSREQIGAYQDCKNTIEQLVSEINGEYGTPGWLPVTYLHRSISGRELIALYRAANVLVVTPLKDGMNLVAKEFCAARSDEQGVLVLSEFAGSAAELRGGALLVNPYDVEGVAAALRQALRMSEWEQHLRMRQLRAVIEANDVFAWCRSICNQTGLTVNPPEPVFPIGVYLNAAQAV